MCKAMFVVAAIMAFLNPSFQIASAAVGHSDCILIMGGQPADKLPIEYYHPVHGVECNYSHILPNFKLTKNQTPEDTSGCYLTHSQMIVVREGRRHLKESTVYSLRDGTTRNISAAYSSHGGKTLVNSISVSMDQSHCLSCGGFADDPIDKCYQFDASTNNWTIHSDLPKKISAAAFVSLGGHFYLVGGKTETEKDGTRNLYVRNDTAWGEKKPMNTARLGHSAAPLSDDEFIVCGGDVGNVVLYSCEIYNIQNDTWRSAHSMTTARSYFAMLTFNDQIYAIGGGSGTLTETVEVYNQTSNTWSAVKKSLKLRRRSFVAFAVTLPPKSTTTLTTTTVTQATTSQSDIPPPDTTKKSDDSTTTTEDGKIDPIWLFLITLGIGMTTIVLPLIIVITFIICRHDRRERAAKRKAAQTNTNMAKDRGNRIKEQKTATNSQQVKPSSDVADADEHKNQ